jgi:hypothetical protein
MDSAYYREILDSAKTIKNEYEWLLTLNDDALSYQVQTRNDVQNALLELLRLTDDVVEYFTYQDQIVDRLASLDLP